MIRILHVSDLHGERETMKRLDEVARARGDCDVVVCTGDCVSATLKEVPSTWNRWPLRLKLLVPGNHDLSDTFIQLRSRVTKVPWKRVAGDVTFVGLDTAEHFDGVYDQLEELFRDSAPGGSAVMIASHQWPTELHARQLEVGFRPLFGARELRTGPGARSPAAISSYTRGSGMAMSNGSKKSSACLVSPDPPRGAFVAMCRLVDVVTESDDWWFEGE